MIVSIHQPNFFPWGGFFNKIVESDTFVLLDDVQYSRGSYINRVKLSNAGANKWLTCPVEFSSGDKICEAKIVSDGWKEKAIRILYYNYKRAPYFEELFGEVEKMVMRDESGVADYNIQNILFVLSILKLSPTIIRQSSLSTIEHSTPLLVEIIKKVGGKTYLCGMGAVELYQDDDLINQNGIEITRQDPRRFSDLSIIDALFNYGIEGTRKMIGVA